MKFYTSQGIGMTVVDFVFYKTAKISSLHRIGHMGSVYSFFYVAWC